MYEGYARNDRKKQNYELVVAGMANVLFMSIGRRKYICIYASSKIYAV